MAEWVRATGSLLAGVGAVIAAVGGVLLVGQNMDKFAERGLTNGLASHMSAADAGKQFGEEAFKALSKMQHDHHQHMGNPKRSWLSAQQHTEPQRQSPVPP